QHSTRLLFENFRLVKFAALGHFEQLVIGYAAPDEERKPAGEFQVAEAIGGARRYADRIVFDAEQKVRADENRAQPRFDSGVEPVFLSRRTIKLQRLFQIIVRDR